MIIEVTGTSVRNKGAELMLIAIREHFAKRDDVELAVDRHFGEYLDRARYGLLQRFEIQRWGRSRLALSLMPDEFARAVGIVRDSDVDVILDAAGFAFGDQHPIERIIGFADRVETARDKGRTVILLPQALGPFEREDTRNAFARIASASYLVFARDDDSMAHARSVVGSQAEHLLQAPDFTNLVKPSLPDRSDLPGTACLVPNQRMVEKASTERAGAYVPFMADCAHQAAGAGLVPFLLVHGRDDADLAASIQHKYDGDLPVVKESDPVELKGILGMSDLVIGSRFHALVGSLSQGVPTIGTSWSHKYEMLFRDYGCEEMLVSVRTSKEALQSLMQKVTGDAALQFRSSLLQRARTEQARTKAMWKMVDKCIAGDDT